MRMSDESTHEIITYHRTSDGAPVSFTKLEGSDGAPPSGLEEITKEEFFDLERNNRTAFNLSTPLSEES
jgi:hypothetical protein